MADNDNVVAGELNSFSIRLLDIFPSISGFLFENQYCSQTFFNSMLLQKIKIT